MAEQEQDQQADWQQGFPLWELRAQAAVFKAADKPFVHGAFAGFNERDVATARRAGTFWVRHDQAGAPVACAVVRVVQREQPVKDFTGQVRCRMLPGDVLVARLAFVEGQEAEAYELLQGATKLVEDGQALFVQRWQESAQQEQVLDNFPLTLVAVKVPASSELLGVYGMARRKLEFQPLPASELWGLRRLKLHVPEELVDRCRMAVQRVPGWADHYSSYNKGRSWSAVALRGYDADDPFFIVKPAEMSKSWKAENAQRLEATVADTPARRALPELEELLALIPGEHQRIRLMRLEPGGGELTRHADITDVEAGTTEGKLLRIHLPLQTNPEVEFTSWDVVSGESYARHMAPGSAWFLDTRKPHTAMNRGETARIHLVVDAYSSPELLAMLEQGSSAP